MALLLLLLLLLVARCSGARVLATSSVWGFGEPQDGGRGAERLWSPRNRCRPSLLPLSNQSQALQGLSNSSGWRSGGPQTPRPSKFPRDARAGFLGRVTLGPEPGTPPPSVGWPPFKGRAPCFPRSRNRELPDLPPGRLFVPSAWKASQRGPVPVSRGPGG